MKLAHGLAHFGLSPAGRVCLDVGASTGGFTHVLLHGGAARVFAVDVGHGQLDWSLRNDPRVVVRERVNARYLSAEEVPEPVGALVCDASFIGLATLLPAPLALCAPGAWACALVKPQFEVGPAVAKGGVVRDPAVHRAVCERVAEWWNGLPGWRVLGVEPSPLLGPEGNREFLLAAVARRRPDCARPRGAAIGRCATAQDLIAMPPDDAAASTDLAAGAAGRPCPPRTTRR